MTDKLRDKSTKTDNPETFDNGWGQENRPI